MSIYAIERALFDAARICVRPVRYDSFPWFWSDQTTARGDPESGGFPVFCFRQGRLQAVGVGQPAAGSGADATYGLKAHLKRQEAVPHAVLRHDAALPQFDLQPTGFLPCTSHSSIFPANGYQASPAHPG